MNMGYILKIGNESCGAVLLEWISGHVALFRLATDLKHIRAGSLVRINMNTMELTLEEAA